MNSSKEEFLNKINYILDEDKSHITRHYKIKSCDDLTYLVNCMKQLCEHYIFEYKGWSRRMPDWRMWKILYKNIIIEINFYYDKSANMFLQYIETETIEMDIEEILNIFFFLEPKLLFSYPSLSITDIQLMHKKMREKQDEEGQKKVEEIRQIYEERAIEKEKKRQEVISKGNWIEYIKGYFS